MGSTTAILRPFLIGNEHERSHEHSKHCCFLIDLASTSWCLDFAGTVFTAVFGSKSRHPKRSRIGQMAVHRSRRDEENMLRMAVAAYTFESKASGTSKGKGKRH